MKRTILTGLCCLALVASIAGCAPQQASPSGDAGTEALPDTSAVSFAMDADCSICHGEQQATLSDPSCNGGKHADIACVSCHADEAALTKVHDGATADAAAKVKRLSKDNAIAASTCESCHDLENLATATQTCSVLTDANGTIANPHAPADGHFEENVTCTSCHTLHKEADLATDAQEACTKCHHANVYECGTCHEE